MKRVEAVLKGDSFESQPGQHHGGWTPAGGAVRTTARAARRAAFRAALDHQPARRPSRPAQGQSPGARRPRQWRNRTDAGGAGECHGTGLRTGHGCPAPHPAGHSPACHRPAARGRRRLGRWPSLSKANRSTPNGWISALACKDTQAAEALARRGFVGPFLDADGRRWHEAGATDAEELGAVLGEAVGYLRRLDSFNDVHLVRAVGVTLAASQDMFATLAKFRAMRLLWAPRAQGRRPCRCAAQASCRDELAHDGEPRSAHQHPARHGRRIRRGARRRRFDHRAALLAGAGPAQRLRAPRGAQCAERARRTNPISGAWPIRHRAPATSKPTRRVCARRPGTSSRPRSGATGRSLTPDGKDVCR